MLTVKCIQKFRDKNNNIICYRLQDCNGNTKEVTPDQLKTAIKNNQITVINLTLTSDNRLVDTTPTQYKSQQKSEEQKINDYIAKAKLLGLYKDIPTAYGHNCNLISKSKTEHIIYIPNYIVQLNTSYKEVVFTKPIYKLKGNIKVIGGKGLKDASSAFRYTDAQSFDFSSFDAHNITNMNSMFQGCEAQSIDFLYLDTHNVTDMGLMFAGCKAKSLDLSSFNTNNVTSMGGMFMGCQAQSIKLSSFDTHNVTNMRLMFAECEAQSLDLSSFDTNNVTDMRSMFCECEAQFLDLSSFNTHNVKDMKNMFYKCKAQIKATDPKIIEAYNNREEEEL